MLNQQKPEEKETMEKEAQDFVEALCRFVEQELQRDPDPIYSQKAVKIADARNHLFRIVEPARTDEAEDLYALADLCRLDEETMEAVPNCGRLLRIARNYWD